MLYSIFLWFTNASRHRYRNYFPVLLIVLPAAGCWKAEPLSLEPASTVSVQLAHTQPESSPPILDDVEQGILIEVSLEKQRAAKVQWMELKRTRWRDTRILPARVELDPDRHFAATAPVDVIVEDLLVTLGDCVDAGDPLLELSSPDMAKLRSDLASGKQKIAQAEQVLQWYESSQENLVKLKRWIEQNESLEKTFAEFQRDSLGKTGGAVLEAYVRYLGALRMIEGSQSAVASGAIAGRTSIGREAEKNAAQAVLQSTIQQSTFELQQQVLQSRIALDEARRALESCKANVRHFCGYMPQDEPTSAPEKYVYRTPRGGTVLERYFARGERANAGETLVLVADLDHLWIVGDLRPQDWDLLSMPIGSPLQVDMTGLTHAERMAATLVLMSGTVNDATGAVRVAASIANPGHIIRPGMFGQLHFQITDQDDAIIIPESARFMHNGKSFLLIQQENEERIRMVPILIGRQSQQLLEILSPIPEHSFFMAHGVFSVASEALLERE